MLHQANFTDFDNASEWAERGQHWLQEIAKSGRTRKRRERNSTPLILCGHGVSLRIEKGALVIRDGFTHYPQKQVCHRFFRGDLALPPRILLLDGSGILSFDVLSWLAEQNVALARVKWNGEVATVASGSGNAADREKVQWQVDIRDDLARRITFGVDLIRQKLTNSIATLEQHLPASKAGDLAIAKARLGADRLAVETHFDLNDIRAIEGECAAAYFAAWKNLPIRWIGTSRHPVPEDWLTFTSRSSLTSGRNPKNRLASHPVNAMLNYAYAVKLAQLQIQAIADGYDPTVGIMHNRHQGSPAFVLDLIEPERPKVDATVLAFIQSRSFSGADFIIRSDGVCRLSPQLARVIAAITLA